MLWCLLFCLAYMGRTQAQTSDTQFKKPLVQVITEIEQRFRVKISYPKDLVQDRVVTYADWRYRPTADETLKNIMASQDISVQNDGNGKFKLKPFQYHLKTVEEGQEQLKDLFGHFSDKASWEARKDSLRKEMYTALKLSPLPVNPKSKPIVTAKRVYDGYTVQNVAIETLPGVYVCGSLYMPLKAKGKMPVVLDPDGHFGDGRYRADCQYRCATQARMGCIAFSYDLFAWGESALQFKPQDHRRALAQSIQALNSIRILDWLLTLKNADASRVAITGGSGGGSQTMLITALDKRITLSMPVVMMSSIHCGGCPCESGMGVQLCGNGTNNVEIAAMAAPRPQLVVSDGKDWTRNVPTIEYPYLQKVYGYYGKTADVENAHFPKEGHDYGKNKRQPTYKFLAKHFNLDIKKMLTAGGELNEAPVTIEKYPMMYVFGEKGEKLPANAVKDFSVVESYFK